MKAKALLLGVLLFGCSQVKADDETITVSSSTVKDIKEKVVELHITFAPTPTAEVKKQRKTLAYNKAGQAICSGSFISPYGHIITARHCVQDSTEITVLTNDGQEYKATSRLISRSQDLAVIQIGKFGGPYFDMAQSVSQGQSVFVLGSPLGITGMLTAGIVARLFGDLTLLDCTVLPGNSGGPVLDQSGNLVGVISAIIVVYAGPSHISVAQSLDSIRMFYYESQGRK